MLIGIVAESAPHETRVAASAETVKKFIALGADVVVERGAGKAAGILDADYADAGAQLVSDAEAFGADIVLKVRRPSEDEIASSSAARSCSPRWTLMAIRTRSRRWPGRASPRSRWS
jgi:H+-translocating NAD(P) transhydrogenase subunit alpha